MLRLIGVREYARRAGVAASTITRQLQKGVVPNRGTPDRPLVDPDEADAARAANLDPAKRRARSGGAASAAAPATRERRSLVPSGELPLADPSPRGASAPPEPAPGGANINRARAAKVGYDALNSRLDFETRAGRLCEVREVERRQFEHGRMIRDALGGLAVTLAGPLVGMSDPAAIRAHLRREFDAMLLRVSGELEALDDDDGSGAAGEAGAGASFGEADGRHDERERVPVGAGEGRAGGF